MTEQSVSFNVTFEMFIFEYFVVNQQVLKYDGIDV